MGKRRHAASHRLKRAMSALPGALAWLKCQRDGTLTCPHAAGCTDLVEGAALPAGATCGAHARASARAILTKPASCRINFSFVRPQAQHPQMQQSTHHHQANAWRAGCPIYKPQVSDGP